jgi:hypothetical protein
MPHMSRNLIRVYRDLDIATVKPHLLVYGDLGGSCTNCNNLDVKLDQPVCPQCKTEFKFYSFRNIHSHFPKLQKLLAQRPSITIIDYEDYKKLTGAKKAEEFFK